MTERGEPNHHRLHTSRRGDERVTPLELFFDLVFVLAITQCTAYIAHDPSWTGIGQAMLVLATLWWIWGGYAWLTSAVDPEAALVRLVMIAAMGALLVTALAVPGAFGDTAIAFALAYGAVRVAHIGLFLIASRDLPDLRRSVLSLAVSSAIGVGLLVAASATDGVAQGALWIVALTIDVGGPYLFGVEGWKIEPSHFAERYGLVVIIALGESIVAIGVGAEGALDAGVIVAAVLGVAVAAGMWWAYFGRVATEATQRLASLPSGAVQNSTARDAYSYLHFPMVAGIVLVAFGLKSTLAHVHDPLDTIGAVGLLGGVALYLVAHVAFRARVLRTVAVPRLVIAALLVALIPVSGEITALGSLVGVVVLLWGLLGLEAARDSRPPRAAS